jgi:hypothetical protein
MILIGAGGVGEEGSLELPRLFLVGIEGAPSGLDEGGNNGCCAILYKGG